MATMRQVDIAPNYRKPEDSVLGLDYATSKTRFLRRLRRLKTYPF